MKLYQSTFKRALDFCAVIFTIPVWFPIFLVVAVLVRINMGGPIFFTQMRGGHKCKPIYLYKFRSMIDSRDSYGALRPDNERITKLGKILRSTSLDELPSLFNVIKGDLSLVGPRPFIYDYMNLYSDYQKRRHDTRPGVTGWAQVNGRNAISWEEKFDLDIWYTENITLLLDIKILILTVKKVVIANDVNSNSDNTMERFRGTKL